MSGTGNPDLVLGEQDTSLQPWTDSRQAIQIVYSSFSENYTHIGK